MPAFRLRKTKQSTPEPSNFIPL